MLEPPFVLFPLLSSSRWLPFDEGASPSFRPPLLGPRASSEVEPKDGPADPRPLRNINQGAARARGLPAMLPALPCAFLSKRTRARIATLFPSMPPARSQPPPRIPSWQACPRASKAEPQSSLDKLLKCTRSPPTKKIKKKIRIFFFARRQVRKL